MTISATSNRKSFTGAGTTGPFSFPYTITALTDLVVMKVNNSTGIVTTFVLNTDYTLSGTADSSGRYVNGVDITTTSVVASGYTLVAYRSAQFTQTLDLVENDPLPAEQVELALDKQTLLTQYVAGRALLLPAGDPQTDSFVLPSNTERAQKYIYFDSAGALSTSEGTGTSSGAGSVTFSHANTYAQGSVGILLKGVVNVCSAPFNAVADGSTDNYTAFAAAITYCQDNLKALYIPGVSPSQYYKIVSVGGVGISITKPITIITDGAFNTVIYVTGLGVGEYAIKIDGAAYGSYEGLDLGEMTIYAGSGDCILMNNISDSVIRKQRFATGRYGLVYKSQSGTSRSITGITRANPAVVTYSGADGYVNGEIVDISGVAGMTQVNGNKYKIANINTGANTFELQTTAGVNVNSTSYTAYSSGGTAVATARSYSNDFEKLTNVGLSGTARTVFVNANVGGGQHNFWGGSLGGDTGFVMDYTSSLDTINFHGTNFEQCTTNSFYVDGSARVINFFGGRTEGCNGVDFLVDPATGNSVQNFNVWGTYFDASDAGASNRIQFGSVGSGSVKGFVVDSCHVRHSTGTFTGNLVYLNSTGTFGRISNNYLDGTTSGCSPCNTLRANVDVYNNAGNNGSFTPVEISLTGNGVTVNTLQFHYSIVGGMVFWQAVVVFPNPGNGSDAELSGLPITVKPGTRSQGRAGAFISWTDYTATSSAVLQGLTSSTQLRIINPATGAALTNNDVQGKQFYMGGFYAVG